MEKFDHIVTGARSSGCALAKGLIANPDNRFFCSRRVRTSFLGRPARHPVAVVGKWNRSAFPWRMPQRLAESLRNDNIVAS